MDRDAHKQAHGSCLCQKVRFRATGKPRWVAHCHCQSCRRNTGSLVATFVGYAIDQVEFVSGQRQFYESSPNVQRGFCANCGTPLSYEADRFPGEIHLYICTLDEPDAFEASAHVYASERVAWFDCHDALPRFSATSTDAKPESFGPAISADR